MRAIVYAVVGAQKNIRIFK